MEKAFLFVLLLAGLAVILLFYAGRTWARK